MALETGLVSQRSTQVCFTQADASEENDVGFGFHESEAKEILDLETVDFFGPVPVEAVKCFKHGEPGQFDAALDGAVTPQVYFGLGKFREILDMGPVLLDGMLGGGIVLLQKRG